MILRSEYFPLDFRRILLRSYIQAYSTKDKIAFFGGNDYILTSLEFCGIICAKDNDGRS